MEDERLDDDRFPVGGSRQAVYDFLKANGFVMQPNGDKHWKRADGVELHVYGAGSRARIFDKDGNQLANGKLAAVVEQVKQS